MTYPRNLALRAITYVSPKGYEYDGNWEHRPQHRADRLRWVWYAATWESADEDARIIEFNGGRASSEAKAIAAIEAWLDAQAATLEGNR